MRDIVFAFAGHMRSGKSTIGRELADRCGYAYASFGDYIRSVATKRGLDAHRSTLQELGAQLVRDPVGLTQAVISNVPNFRCGDGLVIDGVRHLAVNEELRKVVAPWRYLLVFVDTEESIRMTRMASDITTEDVAAAMEHEAESEIDGLRPVADILIASDESIATTSLVKRVLDLAN